MNQDQPPVDSHVFFIFDLDGTLIDFVAVFKEMSRRVWAQYDLELTSDRLKELGNFARSQVQGKSSPWMIVKLLWNVAKRAGLPWHKRYGYVKACGREYQVLIRDIKIFPGIPEALAELRASGYPIALQTSASQEEIQHRMARYPHFLENHIDFALGRDNVENMKPAPDGIFLAAKHFNLPPTRCVFVGDMEGDMKAAQAAGAVGVGVLTGFDDTQQLKSAGADFVLDSVANLPKSLPEILAYIEQRSQKSG